MLAFLRHRLPRSVLFEIKRLRYAFLIKTKAFQSPEREFTIVPHMVIPGTFVIDIGANVGHYTLLFSRLLGQEGTVLAFEPIRETFAYLANNIITAKASNTVIINTAVLDSTQPVTFSIPDNNYYQSRLDKFGSIHSLAVSLNSFVRNEDSVSFIKIDAEGADRQILESILPLINTHRPIVMAEIPRGDMELFAARLTDYSAQSLAGSHNSFLIPSERSDTLQDLF